MLKIFSLEKSKLLIQICLGLGVIIFVALLFFRFPVHDETIYLQESMLMSELFKSGNWVGAYGVGLHGFLFKIPLAILIMAFGPSVLIATLYNYLLCAFALVLVYKLSRVIFKDPQYAWIMVLLTMFGFEFVRSAPTYLREIPSLISVLLFAYLYIKKEKRIWLSIALMLVLDAKEYMFFIIGLSYTITEIILLIRRGINWKSILEFVLSQLYVYAFSIVYLILMFATTIIPLNMFVASIVGLIDRGLGWNTQQFSTDSGSNNVVNSGDVKSIFKITVDTGNIILDSIIKYINIGLGYIGKFLYPRSFSFISIPKLIAIPAFISALIYLKKWIKRIDARAIIPVTIFVFLAIFILRNSHGRYLFSIFPFIMFFFVIFLKDIKKNWKLSIIILSITWFAEMLGIYFETSMVLVKAFISLSVLISILVYAYMVMIDKEKKLVYLTLLAIVVSGVTSFSALAFMYTQGQIEGALKFGREYEMEKIVNEVSPYKRIYTNDNRTTKLLNFYIKDTYSNPLWKWNLKSYLPKSKQLKYLSDARIKIVDYIPYDLLNEENSVLVIFEATAKGDEYQNQKTLPSLISDSRLRLEKKVELKGKNIYLFVKK